MQHRPTDRSQDATPSDGPRSTAQRGMPVHDAPDCIEPGLWRIPVPLPLGLRWVNVYLIDGGDDHWTLVDSGLGWAADEAALRAGLALAGVRLEQIALLILTHAHPDHIGLSGLIHTVAGAPILMLEGEDDAMFQVWNRSDSAAMTAIEATYLANGITTDEMEDATVANRWMRSMVHLPPREAVHTVADGAVFPLGAHTYQAYWTPGHSDHHMCLLRDDGILLAGDHVLPSITPNIGLYPNARPDPLRDYFGALTTVRNLPARLTLPGHGAPFVDLADRVDALRSHHEERSQQMLAVLRGQTQGATAAAVAATIFGPRLRVAEDRRFAVVETLAHLEYLRSEGRVERTMPERASAATPIVYHALPQHAVAAPHA